MKKVIVTGAAGLVGLNLLSVLDTKKYEVIAIDKNKFNLNLINKLNPKVKIIKADLAEREVYWEDLFKDAYCVIQLQAQISDPKVSPYVKNNVISVKNIIEICGKFKIKNLIHISSSVVISFASDDYTKTKTIGENLVQRSSVPHTILRPPLMYGCFDIKHLGFLIKLLDNSPIFPVPGSGKYIRQPLYVRDFVEVIIKLIEKKPKGEIFNVIGKEKIHFINLLKIIAREERRKALFVKIPIPIFVFLLKLQGQISHKKPYVPEQLTALMAGDIFEVEDWESEFNVKYTPFSKGVRDMVNSRCYKYRYIMKR